MGNAQLVVCGKIAHHTQQGLSDRDHGYSSGSTPNAACQGSHQVDNVRAAIKQVRYTDQLIIVDLQFAHLGHQASVTGAQKSLWAHW